jgi:hypothetical protein
VNSGHGESAQSRADPTGAEIREALGKVLSTEPFPGSERRSTLLRHLVEAAISGRAADLKEYAIGLAVFGKGPDYDPRVDPIVRVEIGRLRQKLRAYYETIGAGDSVRIELPKGGYQMRFVRSAAPPLRQSRAWIHSIAVAAGVSVAAGVAGWILHEKTQAGAAPIYQSGFEPPVYHPGRLIGQDGWFTGSYGGEANITVQPGIASTGHQAVQFTATGARYMTRAVRAGKVDNAKTVSISVDAQLSKSGTPSRWELITAWGGGADSKFLAFLGVTSSGELFVRQPGATMSTGIFLTRGVWNHFDLDFNFAANNIDASFNGRRIVSGFEFLKPPGGRRLSVVGFELGQETVGTDTAYFDNFSVRAVP